MKEILLRDLIKKVHGLRLLNAWLTHDVRENNHTQKWINALIRKV